MEILEEHKRDAVILRLVGDLDIYEAPLLKAKLMVLLGEDPVPDRIVLVLKQVKYLDSSGLGTIIDGHRRFARIHSRLILSDVPANIHEVFRSSRLLSYLNIAKSENEALTVK